MILVLSAWKRPTGLGWWMDVTNYFDCWALAAHFGVTKSGIKLLLAYL
jgi:hypothetical protein